MRPRAICEKRWESEIEELGLFKAKEANQLAIFEQRNATRLGAPFPPFAFVAHVVRKVATLLPWTTVFDMGVDEQDRASVLVGFLLIAATVRVLILGLVELSARV